MKIIPEDRQFCLSPGFIFEEYDYVIMTRNMDPLYLINVFKSIRLINAALGISRHHADSHL